jgi:hypothetical protein
MILFNDLKVKFQVLIKLDGAPIEALYFISSTTAKEFVEAYNLKIPGMRTVPGAVAVYNGAFPLD